MVFTDVILEDYDIEFSGTFSLVDLRNVLRDFFDKNNYDIFEKKYKGNITGEKLKTNFVWECEKKIDDYHKLVIIPKIEVKDYKEALIKGKKVVDGNLKVSLNCEIKRDYDEKWRGPISTFLRGLYDKFIIEEKEESVVKEIKNDIKKLSKTIKAHLKLK